jgi:dTDP-4-dehydrorhamnose reductase
MAPNSPNEIDFSWTDERLPKLRALGVAPILTLCHHGSGPHYTSLIDDSFATGLARHAAAVAERYPWAEDYTPVNEPLTTARFSALYGYWYPHTRDEGLFWRALLNEIDATRLAMRAIRRVNPAARLIQTDDLGYCHATEPLQAEADYQNERRWAGWDLLCGMVKPGHALWDRIARFGLGDRLQVIADDPCPPDVIGVNHYLPSERLIDHRIELHGDRALADRALGRIGDIRYVNVDATRHLGDGVIGLPALIEQAWERYGIPVAVTECHHGATRDDQARWFVQVWREVEQLRARGVEVPAVTAWALLGSHDWNRMVTRFVGHYEPGVFDLRGGAPRPTLMASVLSALAKGAPLDGPALAVTGWWHADRRGVQGFALPPGPRAVDAPRPLLIVGEGVLVDLAAQACERRGLHYTRAARVEDAASVAIPWAVFAPTLAPDTAAEVCGALDVPGACASDGAAPAGLLCYATGPVFTGDDGSLPNAMLDALEAGEGVPADPAAAWQGVYGPSLVDGILDLLLDRADGWVDFRLPPQLSLADLAHMLALTTDCDPALVQTGGASPGTASAGFLPPFECMIERFVRERAERRAWASGFAVEAAE